MKLDIIREVDKSCLSSNLIYLSHVMNKKQIEDINFSKKQTGVNKTNIF